MAKKTSNESADERLSLNDQQSQKMILFMLEAKEWSECVEALKGSVDSMYEICQLRQNVFGCEEALIYLQKAVNDFTKLIESIRIEREWDHLEKPRTVAWEIKGNSLGVKGSATKNREEAAWQLVTGSRSKRRKSSNASSQEDVSAQEGSNQVTPTKSGSNVYERLAYGKRACSSVAGTSDVQPNPSTSTDPQPNKPQRNCQSPSSSTSISGGSIMAPRSAMDLPQTRASMAKMAYSRQLLWQQRKKQLAEKLIARQRHENAMANNKRRRSLPSLAKIVTTASTNGRISQQSNASSKASGYLKKKLALTVEKVIAPATSVTNLESIHESVEEEDMEDGNSSTHTMAGGMNSAKASASTRFAAEFMTRSEPPHHGYGLDLSEDEEWRAMTEEEESLAQEEESLKKEIEEEESVSIDDEIQRRASSLDRSFDMEFGEDEEEIIPTAENYQSFALIPPPGWKPTWKEVVAKWAVKTEPAEEEKPTKKQLRSGQQIVEALPAVLPTTPEKKRYQEETSLIPTFLTTQLQPQHYRKPGELALFRAKLLSPSRKKISDEKQLEERQHKAEELRLQLQEDKANRLRELHQKVEEVKQKREEIIERKRIHLEMLELKMKKAEENRQKNLSEIVRKGKEGEQRVLELAFINTLEAENIKYEKNESHARDYDKHQKRIDTLAKERAMKMEQKAAKEAAVEERRRQAEEQRVQRLLETTTRKKEKLEFAEAQRNEQAEMLRKRARQREQKVELRKATDLTETRNLLSKIQQKHEEGTRRYEENLEQVKQKAVEMCSPRPLQSWVALADFSQMPSDAEYVIVIRRCTLCDCEMTNDLQLISHICSDDHLRKACLDNRDIHNSLVDYEFLKDQLENFIKEVELEDLDAVKEENLDLDEQTVLEVVEKPAVIPLGVIKKRKAKLRQKFLRYHESGSKIDQHVLASLTNSKIKPDKRLKELLSLIKEPKGVDTPKHQKSLERAISELHKTFTQSSKNMRTNLSKEYYRSGLIDGLLSHISAEADVEDHSQSSNRIFFKVIHFLLCVLANSLDICQCIFQSKWLPQLCDLFHRKLKDYQTSASLQLLHQATLLLYFIGLLLKLAPEVPADKSSSSTTLDSNMKSETKDNLHEQVQLLSQFLCLCGLGDFIQLVMSKWVSPAPAEPNVLHDSTNNLSNSNKKTKRSSTAVAQDDVDWESINVAKDFNINVLDVVVELVGSLVSLSSHGLLGNCPEKPGSVNGSSKRRKSSCEGKNDSLTQFTEALLKPIIHCLYDHFLANQQQLPPPGSSLANTPRCQELMTSSMASSVTFDTKTNKEVGMTTSVLTTTSTNSSAKPARVNPQSPSKYLHLSEGMLDRLMLAFVDLWTKICGSAHSQAIAQSLLESEPNESFGIRLVHIFQFIIAHCVKGMAGQEVMKSAKQKLLNKTIIACGCFASINSKAKILCVLGWQRSLLLQLCTNLPFEYVHQADLRAVLVPTLIVILFKNPAGLEAIRSEFCLSWLVSYLKDATRLDGENKSHYETFGQMLHCDSWAEALTYFESRVPSNSAIVRD